MKAIFIVAALGAAVATTAVSAFGGGGMGSMGGFGSIERPAMHGYYDGHKDTFLSTDVSDKMQAVEMHANYAPMLGKVSMADTDDIYLVQGAAAAGQIPVFGSEPGDPTYTPLWHEDLVTWKSGSTPVLLVRDDQINSLAKQGKLTVKKTHVILNCPIVSPTKTKLSGS